MAAATGTLYLVDAHSLIFQVFHAIPGMTSPSGLPTNALFGFTRDLLFLRGLRPDYLLCAFDRAEPTFRSDLYADYKAHRAEIPNDLRLQLPLIQQVLEALNVPAISHPRYEADDVLATIARAGAQRGLDVFLCTSDKDCRQLIDDRVRLYNLRKRQQFGRAELLADWGVTPEQVVDLQTLVGDSVDNVPGVKGIGPKTAAKLLQDFGSLENVLANIDKVPGAKKQEALRDAAATIPLTRQLVRLVTDVPVPMDWEEWKLRAPDAARLVALFQGWGFTSLANQFRGADRPAAAPPVQGELFSEGEELFPFGANAPAGGKDGAAANGGEGKASWPHTYHLVDTAAKFDAFFKELKKQKRVAFDTETTSLQPLEAEVVGCSFAWRPGEAWYLALRGPAGSATLDPAKAIKKLRTVLEDDKVAKVNQNIKYDLLVLRGQGIEPRGVAGDPMVADYLLHAGERSHNLEDLARRYLNHQVIPITDLIGKKSKKQPQRTMDQVPTERVAEYAGEDADVAWRLTEMLEERLGQGDGGPALRKLYDEVEVPLIEVLAGLEYNGIRLDVPLLQRLGEEMGKQLAAIEQEIYQLAGHPFNIGSLVQLRKVLFDELKLPVQGKTGVTGAPSTDQETLEKLAALEGPNTALPRKILEQRQITKLKSTYVDALPAMLNPKTGRIHASFNQTVASTGRLSCLAAGTLVNTQRGLVGIETVRPGEFVQTPYGPRRVLAWQATGDKPVVVLQLSNGLTLRCSPEHRVRSLGRWVEARELKVGDPVYLTFRAGLFGDRTELRLDRRTAYRTRKSPQLPSRWTVDLAELVGYLMADGHIATSNYNGKPAKVILAFGWEDNDLIGHFTRLIPRVFGKQPTYRLTRTCPVLEVSGVDIAGAFEQLGAGGKSGDIRAPRSLFEAPGPIVAAFLRGYFEGDGCVGKGAGIQVRSTSRAMLADVQQLLMLFGIPSSIRAGTADPRGYARRYRLLVLGDRSKHQFLRQIGFLSPRKQSACAHFVTGSREHSPAELLTLPPGYDRKALRSALYRATRGPNGRVPGPVMQFASRVVRGRKRGLTLARAEQIVGGPSGTTSPDSCDFLGEVVAGQYFEVRVTKTSRESPRPMYDIAVEDVEQYTAQGVVVHNSSDPNLQNIPVRREQGQQIRQAFVPEPGWVLLTADYSQIELRLLAHFCGDEGMRKAFAEGRDVHAAVAAQIFGVPEKDVTDAQRRMAKTVNFGVIYGISASGLAQRLHIPKEEAARFIAAYFARYPKVEEYQARLLNECRRTGYVGTILGRRRRFDPQAIRANSTSQQRNQAEREAINMEIQGSAADLMKLAMLHVHRRTKRDGLSARMLLTVHDELVFEAPPKELKRLAALVREEMTTPLEKALGLQVPLVVDLASGPNWLDVTSDDKVTR